MGTVDQNADLILETPGIQECVHAHMPEGTASFCRSTENCHLPNLTIFKAIDVPKSTVSTVISFCSEIVIDKTLYYYRLRVQLK